MKEGTKAERHKMHIRNITQYIFDWYGIGARGLQDN